LKYQGCFRKKGWINQDFAFFVAYSGLASQATFRYHGEMNKSELVNMVRIALGQEATIRIADDAIAAVLNAIAEGLRRDGTVKITGFGTFKVRQRPARMGRNLHTGEPMPIKASKSIGFIPSTVLKGTLQE
jgi:DNA-binding protein HU-beta